LPAGQKDLKGKARDTGQVQSAWRKAFYPGVAPCALLLALCKLVHCSKAIECDEAYEALSAAGQEIR